MGRARYGRHLDPVHWSSAPETDYLYNALGQQVQRTVWTSGSPVVTLSVHDLNGNRIAEYDGSGMLLREYLWLDGRPLAVVEDGNTYWLHWDHILRPVMASDAAGAVVWAVRNLPVGVVASPGMIWQRRARSATIERKESALCGPCTHMQKLYFRKEIK